MIGRTKMAVKFLIYKTFDPIQSNPSFFSKISTQSNPIQSMDESNPRPTLTRRRAENDARPTRVHGLTEVLHQWIVEEGRQAGGINGSS